jgi:RNA polymerase sigma-70 factor (ECF subfamily)
VTLLADNQLPADAHPEMNDRNTALMQDLHTNHGAELWRYAVPLTGDHARAEDVVQETLLRAGQDPQIADDSERSGPDEVSGALDRLLIADALTQLSLEHRAVVRRSHYLGWTTAQIADDLQIPEGTVKSRLHYALHALRLTLQEMGVTR